MEIIKLFAIKKLHVYINLSLIDNFAVLQREVLFMFDQFWRLLKITNDKNLGFEREIKPHLVKATKPCYQAVWKQKT